MECSELMMGLGGFSAHSRLKDPCANRVQNCSSLHLPPSIVSVMAVSNDLPLDKAGIISTVIEGVLYGKDTERII